MTIRMLALLVPLLVAAPLVTADGDARVEERLFVGATRGTTAFLIGCANEVDPACFRVEEGETQVALDVRDPFGTGVAYVVRFQAAHDTWQSVDEGPFCGEALLPIPAGTPALYVEVSPTSLTCARLVSTGTITATFT